MQDTNSQDLRDRRTKPSPRGPSRSSVGGFSRPSSPRESRSRHRLRPATSPGPFEPGPTWILLELHALALDDARARSYLARRDCNVALGIAYRARALFKRARILDFLREDGAIVGREGIGPPGGDLDRAGDYPVGSRGQAPCRSRRAPAPAPRGR